ncbi:ATP-binding protein [bacterium]|nr:ATP-binding protein [bacterium]
MEHRATRYLEQIITTDALAQNKMAFISGPRQVGKSTLAKSILKQQLENYFLYEHEEFRRAWSKSPESAIATRSSNTIVLDEIHKDRLWKRKLKGLYDQHGEKIKFIVTGSARLDLYKKGSDSLLGRYLPYRLHPLTVAETNNPISVKELFTRSNLKYPLEDLLNLGGFPEPLLTGKHELAARWSRLRLDQLIIGDSRDILNISDIQAFGVLADLLPLRVGSLLSIEALREDVGKAYATVRSWAQVLETLYYSFTIKPWAQKIARSLKAQPKLYLYDILRIPQGNTSQRLENLTALHLLKLCNYWTDTAQGEFNLHFIRDKQDREVDFIIVKDKQPWMLIECKSNTTSPAKNLLYFKNLLNPQYSLQLVTAKNFDRKLAEQGVRIVSYEKFFSELI